MSLAEFHMFCTLSSLFVSGVAHEAHISHAAAGHPGRALYWRTRAVVVADRVIAQMADAAQYELKQQLHDDAAEAEGGAA